MAFFGPLFDSKTSSLGIPGGHFGTFGLHFGGLGLPRGPQRGPPESKVDFGWILGALGGVILGPFSLFFVLFGVKNGGWVADPVFKWF